MNMKRAACLVFFATAWIVPASAADVNRCAAIADDAHRLACYDNLVGRIAPSPSSAQGDQENIQDKIFGSSAKSVGGSGLG